jgi:hypothetical protein
MQRSCQWCHQRFVVRPEDLRLLERLSPVVSGHTFSIPPPRLCPDCRMHRRWASINELSLHRRRCSLSNQPMISSYRRQTPFPVYQTEAWWSDRWDPLAHGRDFDFCRPFFEQFQELQHAVPRLGLMRNSCENANYVNSSGWLKDCYLTFCSYQCEQCFYGYRFIHCKDCSDCLIVLDSELCHECVNAFSCYDCRYCTNVSSCTASAFLYDCQSCDCCLMCTNLRHKSYCILNRQYTKAEYEQKRRALNLGCFSHVQRSAQRFAEFRLAQPHRCAITRNVESTIGNHIEHSNNCYWVFNGRNLENASYCYLVEDARDVMDTSMCVDNVELLYEVIGSGLNAHRLLFCNLCGENSNDLLYCDLCLKSVKDCFGCIGLRHAQYCILNKQYSAADYQALLPRILNHLDKTVEWGEYFPPALSPYPYNDVCVHGFEMFDRQRALRLGYQFAADEPSCPEATNSALSSTLPDDISEASDELLESVFVADGGGEPFKLTAAELLMYRSRGIPLPREAFLNRHAARVARTTPKSLVARTCDQCGVHLHSAYAAHAPERVVCDQCFSKEVY